MQKIALIDIGSNSIRMALYQIDDQYHCLLYTSPSPRD